jgi:hypothetical protein
MDWPTTALLLGVLGTITTAIIRLVPQRSLVQNTKGEPCATKGDVRDILAAIHEHQKYSETRNHDILNRIVVAQSATTTQLGNTENKIVAALGPISHDLVTLVERTRYRNAGEGD